MVFHQKQIIAGQNYRKAHFINTHKKKFMKQYSTRRDFIKTGRISRDCICNHFI